MDHLVKSPHYEIPIPAVGSHNERKTGANHRKFNKYFDKDSFCKHSNIVHAYGFRDLKIVECQHISRKLGTKHPASHVLLGGWRTYPHILVRPCAHELYLRIILNNHLVVASGCCIIMHCSVRKYRQIPNNKD